MAPHRPASHRSCAAGVVAVACTLLLCLMSAPSAAAQSERITEFRSEIRVAADGGLTVTETISVVAAGDQIRRGIYRDFPTRYDGPFGTAERVGFELVGAWRDDVPEPVRVEGVSNGVRIWLGDPDRLLSAGPYTYRIVYRTDRQLSHLDEVDELYWNVTGNGWAFPIEAAEARLVLPAGARVVDRAGYTGRAGATGSDYRTAIGADGAAVFSTTRTLKPGEGLTIAVSWPKGYVAEPTTAAVLAGRLGDNLGLGVGFLALLVVTGYFLVAWNRVGRDPPKGVIIPLFEAPHGLSPVAVGYIARGGFRDGFSAVDGFAATLTNLAVKGAVTLAGSDDEVAVHRIGAAPADLPPDEAAVMGALFPDGDAVTMGGTYDPKVGKAVAELRTVARRDYADDYVRSNFDAWLPGAVLAAVLGFGALLSDARYLDAMVAAGAMLLFAGMFGAVPVIVFRGLRSHVALLLRGRSRRPLATVVGMLFAALFCIPPIAIIAIMTTLVSPPVLVMVGVLIAVTILFMFLMRAPTLLGRKVLDAIEGYRLYLTVAEESRLEMAAREPELTVERFEAHLPYAMALGVADAWTEKFTRRVALVAPGAAGADYRPRWYRSSSRFASPASMTGHLTRSLSRRVASASTAPRSSSGSSSRGGGSSGRGGGGGGGGGW